MMMGMIRCNVPAVFMYGGSALPGQWRGQDVTILDVYEGVGAVLAGELCAEDLHSSSASPCRQWARARDSFRQHVGDDRRDARNLRRSRLRRFRRSTPSDKLSPVGLGSE